MLVKAKCCDGNCSRTQTILIRQGGLTGQWFAITKWKEGPNGTVVALEKHEVVIEQ